jgi:hypothetical protein
MRRGWCSRTRGTARPSALTPDRTLATTLHAQTSKRTSTCKWSYTTMSPAGAHDQVPTCCKVHTKRADVQYAAAPEVSMFSACPPEEKRVTVRQHSLLHPLSHRQLLRPALPLLLVTVVCCWSLHNLATATCQGAWHTPLCTLNIHCHLDSIHSAFEAIKCRPCLNLKRLHARLHVLQSTRTEDRFMCLVTMLPQANGQMSMVVLHKQAVSTC